MDIDRLTKLTRLTRQLEEAIKICEESTSGLKITSHKRIDLEGKIYAYQFVKDVMLGKDKRVKIF